MPDEMSLPIAGRSRPPDTVAAKGPERGPAPSPTAAETAARAFEAAFLAEMLKHAGLGEAPEGFGGGVGEDQFAGFLREAQARQMADAGGIGIAEYVLRQLADRQSTGADDAAGT